VCDIDNLLACPAGNRLNVIVDPESDSQAWLSKRYKWLQPIFLLFSFIGLLSGAFESVAKFVAISRRAGDDRRKTKR